MKHVKLTNDNTMMCACNRCGAEFPCAYAGVHKEDCLTELYERVKRLEAKVAQLETDVDPRRFEDA